MKNHKNFIRGKQAEEIVPLPGRMLVRIILIEPKPKNKSKIILPGQEEKDPNAFQITDFQGFHPALVEVVSVGDLSKADQSIEPGYILVIRKSFLERRMKGMIEEVLVDDEVLYDIMYQDVLAIANYYRENIKKGKIVKKLKN